MIPLSKTYVESELQRLIAMQSFSTWHDDETWNRS